MAAIINSGRSKIAQKQAAGEVLNIVKFVFANIAGITQATPINLAQSMPAAGNIVHETPVAAQGYITPDQVAYSAILSPDVGNFTFNWIGLVDSDNTLIAVSYTASQYKYKTVGLTVGNTITRNFLTKYSNAQTVTAITVAAEAWQIDFMARLKNAEEHLRQDMADFFGSNFFIGQGFQVVAASSVVRAKAGVGYVSGLRVALAADQVINVGVVPKDIWLDVHLSQSASNAEVVFQFRTTAVGGTLSDYTDTANAVHYVEKIASVSAGYAVTDLRRSITATNGILEELISRINAKANTSDALTKANNLSDLTDKLAARNNLELDSAALASTTTSETDETINRVRRTQDSPGFSKPNTFTGHNFFNDQITRQPVAPETSASVSLTSVRTSSSGTLNQEQITSVGALAAMGLNWNTTTHAIQRIRVGGGLLGDYNIRGWGIHGGEGISFISIDASYQSTTMGHPAGGFINDYRSVNIEKLYINGNKFDGVAAPNTWTGTQTLNSPVLTGNPTAPTPSASDNDASVATTEFVQRAIANLIGSAPGALDTFDELAAALGDNPNFATDIINLLALKAPLASPALTGTPTAPTAAAGTNNTQLANTAFVQAIKTALETTLASKAPLASPSFTGNPTAPTPADNDNDASVATTEFVQNVINGIKTNSVTDETINRVRRTQDSPGFSKSNTFTGHNFFNDQITRQPVAPEASASVSLTSVRTSSSGTLNQEQITSVGALAAMGLNWNTTTHAIQRIRVGGGSLGDYNIRGWGIHGGEGLSFISIDASYQSTTIGHPAGGFINDYRSVNIEKLYINGNKFDGLAAPNTWTGTQTLNSPVLTGNPTAPTPSASDNDTSIATTAFVQRALANLISSAPGALDTLDELAAALGDDPNFATTITNLLASKAPLASPALTGTPTAPTAAAGTNNTQLANTAFVQAIKTALETTLASKAPLASPALTGNPTAPTPPANDNDTSIATTAFVQSAVSGKQNNLGFTPIQQGTGAGQLNNTVKIGWTGTGLKGAVDITDLGNFAFQEWVDANFSARSTATNRLSLTVTPYDVLNGGTFYYWVVGKLVFFSCQFTFDAGNNEEQFSTLPASIRPQWDTVIPIYIDPVSAGQETRCVQVRVTPQGPITAYINMNNSQLNTVSGTGFWRIA